MPDPIDRSGLRPRYWETVPLTRMTRPEWEALCDGCGKCCLNKLEDPDTGEVDLTRVACKLLDGDTCLCSRYATRHRYVPHCISLTMATLAENMYWLPQTCAYRLLWEDRPLYDWHPLISGDPETVHAAGMSLRGGTINELAISEDDWEDNIIAEPGT